jgi:N-acetylglutamate synthase-like GNAT family acetyltransferase
MKQLNIRVAQKNDIPAMANLLSELFAIEVDFQIDLEKQQRGLTLLLESNKAVVFVAEVEHQIIGMCSLQILISTAQGSKVGLIEDLIITKNHQKQGVGKQLLETVKNWAKQQGLTRLQLLADKNNQIALDFYQSNDWKTTQLIALRHGEI